MIEQTVFIPNSSAKEIYAMLMDSKKHSDLIQDTAEIDPEIGGKFATFSHYAEGKMVALDPDKSIKQTWRPSDWPEGHYSNVTFEFTDKDGGCEIHFTQENMPEGTEEEFEAGWPDFYWKPLKKYFS